jgi:hypothetical protein
MQIKYQHKNNLRNIYPLGSSIQSKLIKLEKFIFFNLSKSNSYLNVLF